MVNNILLHRLLFVALCLSLFLKFSSAHVALTYPPARKYDLDFLDNARTKPPCGMPKGLIHTSILSGSKFNVTWHLAYPHRGGFSLQLLDQLDRPVLDLTPRVNDSAFVQTDATAQSFEVAIPLDFTCLNCTLRLLRQADEWSKSYRFWSCADVDVKTRKDFKESCSGHGKYFPSRCKCEKNFYGPQCQFQNECNSNQDCGVQGLCVDHHGTSLPQKQCYCNFGWHGLGCNKRSPYKSTDLDLSAYSVRHVSPDYNMYWRVLPDQDEIEVVMEVNSTTWVAVGWRPRSLNKACKNFPLLTDVNHQSENTNQGTGSSEPEPTSQSEPNHSAEPKPSSEPEPTSDAEPFSEPEPKQLTNREPTSEPEPIFAPGTKSEPSAIPEPTSESSAEPSSVSEPASNHTDSIIKTKRVVKDSDYPVVMKKNVDEISAIATSVSYRVSSKAGRSRRETAVLKSVPQSTSEPSPHNTLPEPSSSEPEPSSGETEPTSAEPEPSSAEPEPSSAEPEPSSAEPEPSSAEPEPSSPKSAASSAEPEPSSGEHQPSSAEPEPSSSEQVSSSAEPEPSSAEPEPASAEPQPSSAEPEPSSAEPEPSSAEPEPSSGEPQPKSANHGAPFAEPEPKSTAEPEPSSGEPIAKYTLGGQKKTFSLDERSGMDDDAPKLNKYTPRHEFNPMDCTDIVIGSARGMASRVGDYYTRDRSTPRHDEFYGGISDLTLGTGFEKNGVTTIIFRKKLIAKEPTDHSITDDLSHVIWAKGQEPNAYIHVPLSGIEAGEAKVNEFYQPDELKYHGHKMQRGYLQMNFFEKEHEIETNDDSVNLLDSDCSGHWKHPPSCTPTNHTCEYYAAWETVGRGDEMRWHIETKNTQTWTGIGFSNDEKMSQTDAIIGWVDRNGRPFLMDTWINGYSSPKLDDRQDIYNAEGHIENGVTTLKFTRKRMSNDEQDLSFSEENCLFLFFPVLGGAFNAVNKKIRKHEQVPQTSSRRVCIKSCGKELDSVYNGADAVTPNRFIYAVGVKLMNLAESFEAPKPGTVEFNNLAATISDSFNGVLNNIPGYYKTEIVGFEKQSGSTMIAKMQAMFDKDEKHKDVPEHNNAQTANAIKAALQEQVTTGKVGSLSVDPLFLDFEALEYKTVTDDKPKLSFFDLSDTRLYTVLGLIAALVFIALVQALCTIFKTSRKNKAQKENLLKNSPWKEFASNTNYAFDPYGETEEKAANAANSSANTSGKEKSRHLSVNQTNNNNNSGYNSQQTTLPMSHISASKSQLYYEGANGNEPRRSRNVSNEPQPGTQDLRSNGRTAQHNVDGGFYDRQERNGGVHAEQQQQQQYGNNPSYTRATYSERAYSLPRQSQQYPQSSGYYTQDRRANQNRSNNDTSRNDERTRQHPDRSREDPRMSSNGGADTPDFYFMPSQRKYSGEVVRVYVDYNKDPKH